MQKLTQDATRQLNSVRTHTPMLDQTKGDVVEFNPNFVIYNIKPQTSEAIAANRNKLKESLNEAATILVNAVEKLHANVRGSYITPQNHLTQCQTIDEIAHALVHNESLEKHRQTLKEIGFPDTFDTTLEENEYLAIVEDLQFQRIEAEAQSTYHQRHSADERIRRFIGNGHDLPQDGQRIVEAFAIEEFNNVLQGYRSTVQIAFQTRELLRAMRSLGAQVEPDLQEMQINEQLNEQLAGMEQRILGMLEGLPPQARAAFNFQPVFYSGQPRHSENR